MKTATTYFVISLIISVLFSSCVAFHAGFPFICFSGACIKNQWRGPRTAIKNAKKKRAKAKAAKRIKAANETNLKSKTSDNATGSNSRSHEYHTYDSAEVALLLKQQLIDFSACTIEKDSMSVPFSANDDEISEAYKDSLLKFVQRLPINAITCVVLKGYCDSTETDTRIANLAFNRALKVFQVLNSLEIPPEKIAITNPPILLYKPSKNSVEPAIGSLQKVEIHVYW